MTGTPTPPTDVLDGLDAQYRTIEIDPAYADTAAFCEHYGYALDQSANAILIASKKPVGLDVVCLVLATHRLDVNHAVRQAMGARKVSFASADHTKDRTGMEIGGVTPFGLPNDLRVLVDAAVTTHEEVIVGGGGRSTKIILNPEVFRRLPNAEIVDGLASPVT